MRLPYKLTNFVFRTISNTNDLHTFHFFDRPTDRPTEGQHLDLEAQLTELRNSLLAFFKVETFAVEKIAYPLQCLKESWYSELGKTKNVFKWKCKLCFYFWSSHPNFLLLDSKVVCFFLVESYQSHCKPADTCKDQSHSEGEGCGRKKRFSWTENLD